MKMKPDPVRTSIDLPRELHRRLHEVAARRGCSARQIILESIEHEVENVASEKPKRRLNLDEIRIPSTGRPLPVTDDNIYDFIDFP